jgi:histidine triad (HIT) family protein
VQLYMSAGRPAHHKLRYVSGLDGPPQVKIGAMADCLFCGIASGEIPATRVRESSRTIAFRDINPQAREHYPDLAALAAAGDGLLEEVAEQAAQIAKDEGVADTGYRVVFNTGPQAGQTVPHAHAHVMGGRPMSWPPG